MKKPPPIPEDDLIAALKARSQKAYSILYDEYAPTLLGLICKVVKNSSDAENLLQETFIKIWKNIDSFEADKSRFFSWLLNIAHSTAVDFLRSRRNVEPTDIQTLMDGVYIDGNPVINAINTNHKRVLDPEISRLDPDLSQIIDLIYFEGYTQQEVANKLNMPLDVIKVRTQLAIQQLKNLFGDANE